ncbi:Gfo/Idh/MocA family protein [Clostridium estertheticum]|uniref:Gfo/Idh/MocA family protein n=1 Tax=Clostridium estertheticum TaxID=238834 RepID=UPI001C0D480C|nr:Gfo/Idh/MocA family oxidoreductase [Clostridium estertheticum]MBU3074251.1 Gfo/Idh/MocA family oxidoreductase [Clostridium estertheticum]MBU3164345.1 Gfo/Idh/MocA family oxidoreductase [Clostridium estertheticum]
MKLLVIGLGSMGKRRISLLKKYFENKVDVVGLDTKIERRKETEKLYGIMTYSNLDEAINNEKPNGVLICTSPISHADLILTCLNKKLNVFTEINLLNDKYHEIMAAAEKNKLELFLSSTFMYRKDIEYIQKEVQVNNKKVHYRYHVGQYLPDWHPWENYKDFFVSNKKTNGCRELFAIELPWILRAFGSVTKVEVIKDNLSTLELDYADSYFVLLEHENGTKGVLNVDIVCRKPIRSLEIYSEEMHLFWEGTPNSLEKYLIEKKETVKIETYSSIDKDNRYSESIIENAYMEELDVFIKKVLGEKNSERYTFKDDLYTLDLINKIEGLQ